MKISEWLKFVNGLSNQELREQINTIQSLKVIIVRECYLQTIKDLMQDELNRRISKDTKIIMDGLKEYARATQ